MRTSDAGRGCRILLGGLYLDGGQYAASASADQRWKIVAAG